MNIIRLPLFIAISWFLSGLNLIQCIGQDCDKVGLMIMLTMGPVSFTLVQSQSEIVWRSGSAPIVTMN